MSANLQQRIAQALARVELPRTGRDVVSSDAIRDLATTTTGKVRLTLMLAPGDDPSVARSVRQALESVEGITDVQINVADAAQDRAPRGAGRALPVMNEQPAQQRVPAPTPLSYPNLGHMIAVSSGKGGVGKSTVSVNLATALAKRGARVGLMDADVYGPNIPLMMGVSDRPMIMNERIVPLEAHGVKLMSLGFIIERDQPAIWRGPIITKVITQFIRDVAWGTLDYFIVDMPPGTGDAQLTLSQAAQLAGAIVVTTPQQASTGDALRAVRMFEHLQTPVPVIGIVENMSWFECPHCGKPSPIFGSGGGETLAREVNVPLIGQVPLDPRVMTGGDTGRPIVLAHPEASSARALTSIAERVTQHFAATTSR